MAADRIDAVVSLAKRRGFVYPSGEIYGGTRSAWDYGPLGVELKDNIKRQWWNAMIRSRDDIVGLDSSVILPRQVWVASGHVAAFVDPAGRVHVLPPSLPGRPPGGGVRGEARAGPRRTGWPTSPARTAAPAAPGPSPRSSTACSRPTSGRSRTNPACTTCARRPRRASSSTTTTSPRRPARSRRSASARSASRSATRSPRATSSSAPASSSRWRWSSSSSRAPTRSGTSTGSTPAPTGTSTWASTATTCASTSIPRRSCPTTRSGPWTSSTASTSRAANGASWRASPTAPTST